MKEFSIRDRETPGDDEMNAEIYFDNRTEKDISPDVYEKMESAVNCTLMLEKVSEECEVSISIVSSEEIKELNSQYRGIDSVTDVLSFPMDEEILPGQTAVLGDVVLCLERAEEQALEFGHGFDRELCYLTVHSVLHLLGYDHMNDEEKSEMRQHEEAVMKELNLVRS